MVEFSVDFFVNTPTLKKRENNDTPRNKRLYFIIFPTRICNRAENLDSCPFSQRIFLVLMLRTRNDRCSVNDIKLGYHRLKNSDLINNCYERI